MPNSESAARLAEALVRCLNDAGTPLHRSAIHPPVLLCGVGSQIDFGAA